MHCASSVCLQMKHLRSCDAAVVSEKVKVVLQRVGICPPR